MTEFNNDYVLQGLIDWNRRRWMKAYYDNKNMVPRSDLGTQHMTKQEAARFTKMIYRECCPDSNIVYLGDYIESYDKQSDEVISGGTVIGIIRDSNGNDLCYKMYGYDNFLADDGIYYISASSVYLHEQYGNTEHALEKIGYEFISEHLIDESENTFDYFVNRKTGDVITIDFNEEDFQW